MFSGLFQLPRSLFARKPLARNRQTSRFLSIEALEDRQLLSASGSGLETDFTPRIISAITPPTTVSNDVNFQAAYNAVGAFQSGPAAGTSTAPTITSYKGTGTVVKNVGGSVYVVTSAQVAQTLTTSMVFYVNIGTYAAPTYTNVGITSITIHSKYDPNNLGNGTGNDIALVKLNSAAALANIATTSLMLETAPPTISSKTPLYMYMAGWGEPGTDAGEGTSVPTKRYGKTKITSMTATQLNFTFTNTASVPGSNYATGDAGAPGFLKINSGGTTKYWLGSIVSYGSKASSGHSLGELRSNTRIDAYSQWMHDIMGNAITAATSTDEYRDLVNAPIGTPSASSFGNTNSKVTLSGSSATATATVSNVLGTRADHDVIKIVVPKAGIATFTYKSDNFDPIFSLYSETTAATASTVAVTSLVSGGTADDVAGSKLRDAVATNVSLAAGVYYIDLSSYNEPQSPAADGSGRGKGTLSISISYDEDGGGNSASLPINSKVLNKSGAMTFSAALQSASDSDFYRFKATVTGLMQVDVRAATGIKLDPMVEIYAADGSTVQSEQVADIAQNDDLSHLDDNDAVVIDSLNARKTVSVVAGQYYFVKISGVSTVKSGYAGYTAFGGYSVTVKTIAGV